MFAEKNVPLHIPELRYVEFPEKYIKKSKCKDWVQKGLLSNKTERLMQFISIL